MNLFIMIMTTIMFTILYILPSRIISMTFKTSAWSITIKNDRLAEMLIAEKNTWGIATDFDKRNKMSLLGIISYILILPQIVFIPYNWLVYIQTGSGRWCEVELTYFFMAFFFYFIAISIKIKEGIKFSKGEIW